MLSSESIPVVYDERGGSDPVDVFYATGTGSSRLELPVHKLRTLRFASLRVANAYAIVQPPVGFADPEAVGFFGNSVLDKLDPWLDYAGGCFGITRA